MKISALPDFIRPFIIPEPKGKPVYRCLNCQEEFSIDSLLYTCPKCKHVLLIYDLNFDDLKQIKPETWQQIFDYRKVVNIPALNGVYRYHELIGPIIPLTHIIYLGEGHTPMIEANMTLQNMIGIKFYYKNDGQNPSASFKDRGMASALSYLNYLIQENRTKNILAICASTGDTSAAAALYSSYLSDNIKSAVLLPHKKVTPQQLGQPLGSGARVFEVPGVFDDCMKIVEALSSKYNVALLNSKNAWRILGQESYSYEIAQDFEYDLQDKAIFMPIGNAGNITAIMSGFIKFFQLGIIDTLPKIIGVQSHHANPVYKYYLETDTSKRVFKSVDVKPSTAQAAMIGNPVSMPRVIHMVDAYNKLAGQNKVYVVEVTEQQIMDWYLTANKHGHISCTHGGECLAGLVQAKNLGIIDDSEVAILDSTAHALKFSNFQNMYFKNSLRSEYGVVSKKHLVNSPEYILPSDLKTYPKPGQPLAGEELSKFVNRMCTEIANLLDLKK